jgi:hypothetical protein
MSKYDIFYLTDNEFLNVTDPREPDWPEAES